MHILGMCVHRLTQDIHITKPLRLLGLQTGGGETMNTLGELEKLLLAGEITEEEYRERKEVYVETILELYVKGIIDKEQMEEKLNG